MPRLSSLPSLSGLLGRLRAGGGRLLRRDLALRVLLPLGLVAAFAVGWLRCGLGGCPNIEVLRAYQPGKASRLLDRNGRVFAELRPVEGETVPLGQLSRQTRDAFLAVEDRRFFEHGALDWRRVAGAALVNLRRGEAVQGFSTITMQLARNVFPERIHGEDRTLGRKLAEIRVAYAVESRYGKEEILELYLSHIYFGNGARGIEAAARHYFGTSSRKLSLSQSALLAALIRGPGYYDPRRHPDRARRRRNLILAVMERQHRITGEAASRAEAAPLGVVPRRPWPGSEPGLAPYYLEEIRRQVEDRFGERVYSETLQIETTLDPGLQRAAEEELERQLRALERGALGRLSPSPREPRPGEAAAGLQGAVVVLQVGTGDVLAWVGGRDFRDSRFDRVKSSRRQVGSAFKPFVYAAALQQGHPLSERLRDEPLEVRLKDGRLWQPRNFDGEYEGTVTVREALVRSKNVPTVRLAQEVGIGRIARTAHEAGIHSEIDETPAMPLGTAALSPLELATAYSAFAALGELVAPRMLLRVRGEDGRELWAASPPPRRRVLDPAVAFLVTDVLEEAVERGTGTAVRSAGFQGRAAGKTGTTNDATDAWFVGYTPAVTSAVWIGFDEPRPIMALASGGRLAAPVWGRLMARARLGPDAATAWRMPDSVEEAWVDPGSGAPLRDGCRPRSGWASRELFLRDAMPRRTCPAHGDPIALEPAPWPSDEDAPREFGTLPDEDRGRSEAPPPRDYEEADWPHRRAEEWRRTQPQLGERQRREWGRQESLLRVEADRVWRAVRRQAVKRLLEWRRRQERRRQELERDERRRQQQEQRGG